MNTMEVTNRLQDYQKCASQKAKDLGKVTDTYVRENTWSTLAMAALLGCVLGYFLTTRRD